MKQYLNVEFICTEELDEIVGGEALAVVDAAAGGPPGMHLITYNQCYTAGFQGSQCGDCAASTV